LDKPRSAYICVYKIPKYIIGTGCNLDFFAPFINRKRNQLAACTVFWGFYYKISLFCVYPMTIIRTLQLVQLLWLVLWLKSDEERNQEADRI